MTERAERIFEQSLTLSPKERAAFIDEACQGDSRIREEVTSLLNDADDADRFFDRLDEAVFSSPPSASGSEQYSASSDATEFQQGDIVAHYRIDSLIGRGGMGSVYRAYDTRLNRDVALKFLPSHLGAEPEEQARLLAEARAAAALDHPNVCSIHEIGETQDGRLFIAMPCYSGETLKERMRRDKLSTEEAVAIAVQIARGLAAAHSHGIVHRDVKPGNIILLSDGTVRLLDFGLAVPMNASLIKTEITPGTVAYMSPEQIRGTALDSRTDLWSLGVVLYEMLAGTRPFSGPDHRAIIRAILHDEAEPLEKRCPGIPQNLTRIVDQLLQKDPAGRYERAAEVVSDLQREVRSLPAAVRGAFFTKKRSLIAGGALALLAVAGVLSRPAIRDRTGSQSSAVSAQPSLAILPLKNFSADSADAALATGITEDLIATIASAGDVRVVASTSVASLKRGDMDIRQIADTLGVDNVLEGAIQKAGNQLRVQVRLIDGRDGSTRWSQSYDREFKDLFTVRDAIVGAVAGELQLRFDKDRQFVRQRPANVQAYVLYLRGWDPVLLRSQSGIWKAQDYFQKAIALDSTYAPAHAGLALTYIRRARNASDPGMPVPQLLGLADSEARKAIRFDSTLAEGHYALGRVREAMLDFPAAEALFRHAIELDPNRSIYRRNLSYIKAWSGHSEEELAEARLALETDPLNPYALAAVASGMYGLHRYDEALAQLEKLTAVKPPLQGVSFAIAQCYAKKGMWDKAIATLRPGAEAGDPLFTALLGHMLGKTNQRDEANRILADLKARRERTGVGAFHIAVVYAGLGDLDETFAWLDKSIDDRSIVSFIMGPTFEDLRRDRRFNLMRRRLGLADIAG